MILLGIYIGGALILSTTAITERSLWPELAIALTWPLSAPVGLLVHWIRFRHFDPWDNRVRKAKKVDPEVLSRFSAEKPYKRRNFWDFPNA